MDAFMKMFLPVHRDAELMGSVANSHPRELFRTGSVMLEIAKAKHSIANQPARILLRVLLMTALEEGRKILE